MITVRPIVYTENAAQYLRILNALGGETLVDQDGWKLVQLDGGRVAFHSPMEDFPVGQVDLCLEVDDIDAWAETCGTTVEEQPFGREAKVRTSDGMSLAAHTPSAGESRTEGKLHVQPIWATDDVDGARKALSDAGLEERVSSDSGVWVDFRADSGQVAVHAAEEGTTAHTVLGFEYDGDVDDLVGPLESAGANPRVIDETYGRSLQFDDPDGGKAIWINEVQTDFYGYSVNEPK